MKKGRVLITIGLLLIAAALCLVAYNMLTSYKAGIAASEVAVTLEDKIGSGVRNDLDNVEYPDYVLNPEMDMPVVNVDGKNYVGLLRVPSISMRFPVFDEWNYYNLKTAPCCYSGTPYMNNFVICAHNYRTHFGQIKTLQVGDEVFFTDVDGNRFVYTVVAMETLPPTAVEDMKTGNWDLTLFTCTVGGATRLAIRCELSGTDTFK